MNNAFMKTDLGCRNNRCYVVSPFSLLNLEMPCKDIRPLKWLIGFIFVSQFIVAFSDIDTSFYFISILKLSLLGVTWFLATTLLENDALNRLMPNGRMRYPVRAKMMLVSLILWSISFFLYIQVFLA